MRVHFDHHGEELIKLHNLFADLKKELEVHFVRKMKSTSRPSGKPGNRENHPELIADLRSWKKIMIQPAKSSTRCRH